MIGPKVLILLDSLNYIDKSN